MSADSCPAMNHLVATPAPGSSSQEATEFIELLQLEIAQHEIELPGSPHVAMQLQQLLTDEEISTDRVVRLVSTEPILASRVVRLASSVALNPRGTPVRDLRNAVARVGFNALRAAATSFAITQLKLAERYKSVMPALTTLWRENVAMAAAACAVARRCQRVSPETALFAGLVSSVGKICLLARSVDSPYMAAHPGVFQEIVRDWHAEVAHSLLTNWGVAEDIIDAVYGYQSHRAGSSTMFSLTDVLAVAEILSDQELSTELRLEVLQGQYSAKRLGLRPEECLNLMEDSKAELELLRSVLVS